MKGWKAASRPWVIIANSNVLMPRDYIQRLMARWRADTGIVCAPPIGSQPGSFAAEVECAFLNTYQARWQYAAETLGFGFAQGKTMLWRRDVLEAGGGIEALGAEIAEDAAATKLIHRAGLRAHLVSHPFQQPLGARALRDVWARQVRWARLRRATFALYFAPELLTTSLFALIAAAIAAPEFGLSAPLAVILAALLWYGAEAALARAAGWPLAWSSRARLDRARSDVAVAVDRGLEGQALRLARQRDVRRRRRRARDERAGAVPAGLTAPALKRRRARDNPCSRGRRRRRASRGRSASEPPRGAAARRDRDWR